MFNTLTGESRTILRAAACCLALSGLAACGSSETTADDPAAEASTVDLAGSRWEIVEIDSEIIEIGINTVETPRVSFRDATVTGHDGCNGFDAEYEVTGSTLSIGNAEGEQQGCSIPDGADQLIPPQRVLNSIFDSANGVEVTIEDETMNWTGSGHTVVLQSE